MFPVKGECDLPETTSRGVTTQMITRERPEPPVDERTGLYRAPLTTIWRPIPGYADSRPVDSEGRILLDEAALNVLYTCMSCSKPWRYGDPGFVHFRFGPAGSPTEGMVVENLGWFSRCRDRQACAHRVINLRADQHPEALTIADEADLTGLALTL